MSTASTHNIVPKGGFQVKGIGFDQFSIPVLASTTLWMIFFIASIYHLIVGITDFTNDFQNTLK